MKQSGKSNYEIRAVQRALSLLQSFGYEERELGISELARRLDLNKSTVYRLLTNLQKVKFVEQDPQTGKYRLGIGLFEMGSRVLHHMDLHRVSRPYLEELSRVTRQTVHLVVPDGREAVYVEKVEHHGGFLPQYSRLGKRAPLHCTAVGKVLLAGLNDSEVERFIREKGLRSYTRRTITSPGALMKEIQAVRDRGYAVDNEEIQDGLMCVAAPVFNYNGETAAAVSISGMAIHFTSETLPGYIEWVKDAARRISTELGYRVATQV